MRCPSGAEEARERVCANRRRADRATGGENRGARARRGGPRGAGPDLHAFDWSPVAERTRRYERVCQRTVDRIDRELGTRFCARLRIRAGLCRVPRADAERDASHACEEDGGSCERWAAEDEDVQPRNEANADDGVDSTMNFVDDGRTHVGEDWGDTLECDESMMSYDNNALDETKPTSMSERFERRDKTKPTGMSERFKRRDETKPTSMSEWFKRRDETKPTTGTTELARSCDETKPT